MFETKTAMPFVSVEAYNKLTMRAVLLNDAALLKRLINDVKTVSNVFELRSVEVPYDALWYAIIQDNFAMMDTLMKEMTKPKQRVQSEASLLSAMTTGRSNYHMLGRATRPIQMSRRGKEGNNALLKEPHYIAYSDYRNIAVQKDISFETIQKMVAKGHWKNHEMCHRCIVEAVRRGHRKLAAKLIATYGVHQQFNELHQQVLDNDNQKLKPFKSVSVKKKGNDNASVTPLHCACINPNPKYLEELLKSDPSFSVDDEDRMKCVHYAAACSNTKPMELLLANGASLFDIDKHHNTVLHHACRAGRDTMVEFLCKKFIAQEKENLEEDGELKMAFIQQRNREGYAAIHIAAAEGHLEVIKVFAKVGADLELRSNAKMNKVTPIILAAAHGHMPIVKYLYETQNVPVDKGDKLKRTALLHACLNGMAHVVSYLLRIGCNPDTPDSSGNSPLHYAAAYGWYFVMKLLLEAGASVNAPNDWQLTPLAVAYLKGHIGLVDLLLEQKNGSDINCKDNNGKTLIMLTLSAQLDLSVEKQLKYLIEQKKADCSIKDSCNNSALHYLATVLADGVGEQEMTEEQVTAANESLQIRVADLLVAGGCDLNTVNDQDETALSSALKNNFLGLAKYLLDKKCQLGGEAQLQKGKDNVLHDLVTLLDRQVHLTSVFKKMAEQDAALVKNLLTLQGKGGMTPFLLACSSYSRFVGKKVRKHLANARKLIQKMAELNPDCLLQQMGKGVKVKNVEEEEEDDDYAMSFDDEDHTEEESAKQDRQLVSCLHLAVEGNQYEKHDNETPLLTLLLDLARRFGSLNQLLVLKAADASTAMVKAIEGRKPLAVECLLKYTDDANALFTRKVVAGKDDKETDANKQRYRSKWAWQRYLDQLSSTKVKPKEESSPVEAEQKSLIMLAIEHDLVAVVRNLLLYGGDFKHKDSNGDTALHYAARKPTSIMAEIIAMLLQAGADPLAQNNKRRLPLHLACNGHTGAVDANLESIVLLKKEGGLHSSDTRGRLPLHYAFVKVGDHPNAKQIEPISLCSAIVPDMQEEYLNQADAYLQTPLHCAAKRGSTICCMTLLRHQSVVVNAQDQKGMTPLGLAVSHGHQHTALTLLQAHASINIPVKQTDFGIYSDMEEFCKWNYFKYAPMKPQTPQEKIVQISDKVIDNDWQAVVYVLLDLLPRDVTTIYGLTTAAISNKKYNLAITLISMLTSSVNDNPQQALDEKQQSVLHECMAKHRSAADTDLELKVAKQLVASNIHWYAQSGDGVYRSQPFLEACKSRNYNLLKFYMGQVEGIASQFYTNLQGFEGTHNPITSLMLITTNHELGGLEQDLLKTFYSHGVSPHTIAEFPLMPQSQLFIGTMSTEDMCGTNNFCTFCPTTLLIYAIQTYSFESVKFLITDLQCDINQAEPTTGRTPLMVAVSLNDQHKVKLLMDHAYVIPKDGEIKKAPKKKRPNFGRKLGQQVPMPTSQFSNATGEEEEEEDEEDDEDHYDDEDYEPEEIDEEPPRKKGKKTKAVVKQKQPSFPLRSNLMLNAMDVLKRNAIHYLIRPFITETKTGCGSWENVELLDILLEAGAQTNTLDHFNKFAIDYAKEIKDGQLIKHPSLKSSTQPEAASDAMDTQVSAASTAPDYRADAAKFLGIQTEKMQQDIEQQREKRRLQPHSLSDYATTGELVQCKETNRVCAVLLNKVDVQQHMYGFYNFYRLQLIRRKGAELYIVFTNWGRIGDSGQFQRTPFGAFDEAMKEFSSIFKQKTGNEWSEVNAFVEKPKKYHLLPSDDEERDMNMSEIEINLDSSVAANQSPEIVKLMMDISNVQQLQMNSKRVSRQSRYLLPFGMISREVLSKARAVLVEIGEAIFSLQKLTEQVTSKSTNTDDKCLELRRSLVDLSNQYYHLVPLGGFSDSTLPVIDGDEEWREHCATVDSLLASEVASQLVSAAAFNTSTIHPADYIYSALDYDTIRLINPDSDEAQLALHYIYQSSPDVHVTEIYEVKSARRDDSVRKQPNRRMLWHGTSAANLLSILQEGLLPAPPTALHTGHMFGKGIYFADLFEKSRAYCRQSASGSLYALLCEVSLGKICKPTGKYGPLSALHSRESLILPDKAASLRSEGRRIPDPNYDLTLNSGAQIPLGETIERQPPEGSCSYFQCNEYIVFNPKQVAIRYLVAFQDTPQLRSHD